MKGQVWQEYVLVFAGVVLIAVVAIAHVYKPSTESTTCSTVYMRAQSEITRQEFLNLTDYAIYIFNCDFDGDPPEINIACKCSDHTQISGAVKEELKKFGITDPKINVRHIE